MNLSIHPSSSLPPFCPFILPLFRSYTHPSVHSFFLPLSSPSLSSVFKLRPSFLILFSLPPSFSLPIHRSPACGSPSHAFFPPLSPRHQSSSQGAPCSAKEEDTHKDSAKQWVETESLHPVTPAGLGKAEGSRLERRSSDSRKLFFRDPALPDLGCMEDRPGKQSGGKKTSR